MFFCMIMPRSIIILLTWFILVYKTGSHITFTLLGIRFVLQGSGWRECRGCFHEKLSEASSVSEKANAICLQGWAHQSWWQPLCDDRVRKTEVLKTDEKKRTAWREWEYVKETALQTPRLVKQDREKVLHVPGEKFPCCSEDHGETDCSSAAYGRPWGSRYPSAAHGGSHVRADGCLKNAVILWEAHTGADSQQDLR